MPESVSTRTEEESKIGVYIPTNLKVISKTVNLSDLSDKLLSIHTASFLEKSIDIVLDSPYEVVHLNIDKLRELLAKPFNKLRKNQKMMFYNITPTGQTVLHALAYIISKTYEQPTTELTDMFWKVFNIRDMPTDYCDSQGKNVFNYLINDSTHIDSQTRDICHELVRDHKLLPNRKVPNTILTSLTLNIYPVWTQWYAKLKPCELEIVIENMNKETYSHLDNIIERIDTNHITYPELRSILNQVLRVLPNDVHKFYRHILSFIRNNYICMGCVLRDRFATFIRKWAKTAKPEHFMPNIQFCSSYKYLNFLMEIHEDTDHSMIQIAVLGKNYSLVDAFLQKLIDEDSISYDNAVFFTDHLKEPVNGSDNIAQMLIKNNQMDIIKKIITLTSESIVAEYLSKHFRDSRPDIFYTSYTYTCSTCWEDIENDNGYIFYKCGHFPFCKTCFFKMEFCPYCYDQSKIGKTYDLIKEIESLDTTTIDISKMKLWDVAHCLEDDTAIKTPASSTAVDAT